MNPENNTEEISDEVSKVLNCLQNPLDFELMMYFLIYRELSLSQLEEMISYKSRPTVYRHIQNLLEAGIITESREEKVRSNIKAKYYEINPNAMNILPHYSLEQITKMSVKEKNRLYENIREALYPTINFMENILSRMIDYLKILKPHPESELLEEFDKMDFHLNLNFLSEKQYQFFMEEFQKFMMSCIPKIIEEEQKNPTAEKTYIYLTGLLPIRKMIDRLMKEKIE
ncbi:MAG: hypothetical protein ACFFDW_11720 [Candidatus Thorarchaeota archaeon]